MLWYFPAGHWTAVVPWRWSRWAWFAGLVYGGGGSCFGMSVISLYSCRGLGRGQPCASGWALPMQGMDLDEMAFFHPSCNTDQEV